MSNHPNNPYAAPNHPNDQVIHPHGHGDLAGLGSRLGGAIIDGIIMMIIIVPLAFILGMAAVMIDMNVDSFMFNLISSLVMIPISAIAFLLVNGYLLATKGQTVGKYIVKTKIVGDDGSLQPLIPLFLKRYGVIWVLASIPFIGRLVGLVDSLMVFRESRKCLHDEIAGTKVVNIQ